MGIFVFESYVMLRVESLCERLLPGKIAKLDVVLEGSLDFGTLEACMNRFWCRGLSIREI